MFLFYLDYTIVSYIKLSLYLFIQMFKVSSLIKLS